MALMLEPVDAHISAARKKIAAIGLLTENFQYDTEGLKNRLDTLEQKCKEQIRFLKKYLVAGNAERQQMMYQ